MIFSISAHVLFNDLVYLDAATIGVDSVLEEVLEELLIQTVDSVVESEQDKLWRILIFQSTWDLRTTTKTIRQPAETRVATVCLLTSRKCWQQCCDAEEQQ